MGKNMTGTRKNRAKNMHRSVHVFFTYMVGAWFFHGPGHPPGLVNPEGPSWFLHGFFMFFSDLTGRTRTDPESLRGFCMVFSCFFFSDRTGRTRTDPQSLRGFCMVCSWFFKT